MVWLRAATQAIISGLGRQNQLFGRLIDALTPTPYKGHMYIKTLRQLKQRDSHLVGGKAASLGELMHHDLTVPEGFALTAAAYSDFYNKDLSQALIDEVYHHFDELNAERVAVRSSALNEDAADKSSAGMYETFLNVPRHHLIAKIQDCWRSAAAERVVAYAEAPSAVGVVIQRMRNPKSAGVIFTVNPVTKADDQVIVEAVYGLAEPLVQGLVTPDSYVLSRSSLALLDQETSQQTTMLTWRHGQQLEVALPKASVSRPILSAAQLTQLGTLALQVEAYYGLPLDIEWAFENSQLYLLQARPITTL